MDVTKRTLEALGYLITVLSLIPLIRSPWWFFRIFDYPRLQKLIIALLVTLSYVLLIPLRGNHELIFLGITLATIIHLLYQILPFTPISKVELETTSNTDPENRVRLFIANVHQSNRRYQTCLNVLNSCSPHIVLLMETNEIWARELSSLEKEYKFHIKVARSNTYGMMLFSNFPLTSKTVQYLVEEHVPSIHASVKLPSGRLIHLHCLHPSPPVPNENPDSTERDKELIIVAKMVKKDRVPTIVAGDLNDVAWSQTTSLFSKISGLLDPRKGRGFFNTFHARYFFMRFPLDHIFCSDDFKLVQIKRMPDIGSDHFPMFIELELGQSRNNNHDKPSPDGQERKQADKKLAAKSSGGSVNKKRSR
jgi:endonuclease/exonuclease/phosphatase (EEP) superfamily protein YafD